MDSYSQELHTVELKPADFDLAADLLTEAFQNNPSHVYIFSDISNKENLLKWGLKANLKLNLTPPDNIGKSFALVETEQPPGSRKIKAMGFWHPPKHSSLGIVNKLTSGWAIAPWKFGWQTYQRLMSVMGEMERIKTDILNGESAWYLNNMAVAKELRGTGVGTQMLRHQLESIVDPSGFRAILMTQKAGNVMFYRRLGFEVATESKVGQGEHAFTNWCMTRHLN